MSSMTDYLENRLVDHILRGQTFTAPANLHAALFTTATTEAGGGTEVTGGSYARVAVACSLANWAGTQSAGSTAASSGTGGATSNNNAITFPTPTAAWGTVTHVALFDASSGGNMLFHGPLTTSKTPNIGDPPTFPAGSFGITFA